MPNVGTLVDTIHVHCRRAGHSGRQSRPKGQMKAQIRKNEGKGDRGKETEATGQEVGTEVGTLCRTSRWKSDHYIWVNLICCPCSGKQLNPSCQCVKSHAPFRVLIYECVLGENGAIWRAYLAVNMMKEEVSSSMDLYEECAHNNTQLIPSRSDRDGAMDDCLYQGPGQTRIDRS
jgi:hypothetical protein